MPSDPKNSRPSEPARIPPTDAEADAIERVAPKRPIQIARGDIVIVRERVPRVNQHVTVLPWRFRVQVFPDPTKDRHVFNSFQHAAFAAEELASKARARVIYVEDHIPSVVADYRY